MTKWSVLAAVVVTFGAATSAQAHHDRAAAAVDGWYHQYLGRCADSCGLRTWAGQLRCGKSPDCVLAGILASDEYYQRHGCCDTGFIKGLYHDHLGRCASRAEVHHWQCELNRCRSRYHLAHKFLCAGKRERRGW
jgi:hypothetical protein